MRTAPAPDLLDNYEDAAERFSEAECALHDPSIGFRLSRLASMQGFAGFT